MASHRDRVFLTGVTGFVGRHVARALLDSGYDVKAMVRPGRDGGMLRDRLPDQLRPDVEPVAGDVLEAGYMVDQLRGCRYLIHAAALYSFAPADRKAVRNVNVLGTASMLEAARLGGVEKVVITSSSATVGPARPERLATECDWAPNDHRGSSYHRSKIEQERAAFAAQIPTVLVLPTAPVGPGDSKPTPTGKMIVDFMRGRIFASFSGGLNLVAVEDVAHAHVLGLEQGRENERYLIGGTNLPLAEVFRLLSTICKRPAPSRQIPYSLAFGLGIVDELRCRLRPGDAPVVPLEGVRIGREHMYVSSAKAETELGFKPSPVVDALERAVKWYRDQGYA